MEGGGGGGEGKGGSLATTVKILDPVDKVRVEEKKKPEREKIGEETQGGRAGVTSRRRGQGRPGSKGLADGRRVSAASH